MLRRLAIGLLSTFCAAPAVAQTCSNWNLDGNYICTDGCQKLGGQAKVNGAPPAMSVINEMGQSSSAFFDSANVIRAPGFTDATNPAPNGMKGSLTLEKNHIIIAWSAQTASRWRKVDAGC